MFLVMSVNFVKIERQMHFTPFGVPQWHRTRALFTARLSIKQWHQ